MGLKSEREAPVFSIAATCWALLLAFILSGVSAARGAQPARAEPSTGPRPIPVAARAHQREITATAYRVFGPRAPVSVLAAQLHQESGWRANARSPVGAIGLAQFMPATARDMGARHPAECAPVNPLDPSWAIRCQQWYMRSLLDGTKPVAGYAPFTACSGWAFGLSAYNGGAGWVSRDRRRTQAQGFDPNRWFGHVELHPDPRRAPQFVRENRGYPRRILLTLTPQYVAGGWGRGVTCEEPRDERTETLPAERPGRSQARPLRLRTRALTGAARPTRTLTA